MPKLDNPRAKDHLPPILPRFTFHQGWHTPLDVAGRERIPAVTGYAPREQKMKGITRLYDHVTPKVEAQVLTVLDARWFSSMAALGVS